MMQNIMEWQPIETAPKDKRILLFSPGWFLGDLVEIGRWDTQQYHRKPKPYWSYERHKYTQSVDFPPTHWMPLPDHPTKEA